MEQANPLYPFLTFVAVGLLVALIWIIAHAVTLRREVKQRERAVREIEKANSVRLCADLITKAVALNKESFVGASDRDFFLHPENEFKQALDQVAVLARKGDALATATMFSIFKFIAARGTEHLTTPTQSMQRLTQPFGVLLEAQIALFCLRR